MIFPPDVDRACETWGANCGPCSLAAILDMSVEEIRPYLGDFETRRRYMNVTHLKDALTSAGRAWRAIGKNLPQHGLAFIQWGGHENRPFQAQYQYTHWIAVDGQGVFEVNAPHLVPWDNWQEIMPAWMQEEKRGDGTFFVRSGIEVAPC